MITIRQCPKCKVQALEVLLDRSGKILKEECLLCSYGNSKSTLPKNEIIDNKK